MNEFNVDTLQEIFYLSFWTALKVAMPYLLGGFILGVLISIIQSAMQLQDATINFFPKVIVLLLLTLFLGPYILSTYTDYFIQIIQEIALVK
jgi:flagellar biosynthesis protein FliQ